MCNVMVVLFGFSWVRGVTCLGLGRYVTVDVALLHNDNTVNNNHNHNLDPDLDLDLDLDSESESDSNSNSKALCSPCCLSTTTGVV